MELGLFERAFIAWGLLIVVYGFAIVITKKREDED